MTHPSMSHNSQPPSLTTTTPPQTEITSVSSTNTGDTEDNSKSIGQDINERSVLQQPAEQVVRRPIRTVNRLNQTVYVYRSSRPVTEKEREKSLQSKNVTKIVWGPNLWKIFHTLGYYFKSINDDSHRQEIGNNIWNMVGKLIETIPCPSCKYHATNEFKHTVLVDFNNKSNINFFELWAFNFHNKVNTRIRRPIYSHTDLQNIKYDYDLYKLVDDYYDSIKANKKRLDKTNITIYIDNMNKLTIKKDDNITKHNDKQTQDITLPTTGTTSEVSLI